MKSCVLGREIRIGDVVDGPDGPSTVIGIENKNGSLNLDFAEGKGNRCWSVFSEEDVRRLKLSDNTSLQGFVVDRNGSVIQNEVVEVHFQNNGYLQIVSCDSKGTPRINLIPKSKIGHITGYFRIYFK